MAQTAEEALVVRMEATLTRFERQMQRAKQVAEGTSVGMERRFDKAAKNMAATADRASASVTKLGNAGSGMGRQIQNASYQVGDFAVQVAAGTDPLRAMAQQLPQLLSGIGVFGAVAGAAAAILVPFAGALFDTGEASMSADEALKSLRETTDGLKSSQDILSMSLVELYGKYGLYALNVRESARALTELKAAEAQAKLADMVNTASDAMDRYVVSSGGFLKAGLTEFQSTTRIMEELNMSASEAVKFRDAITDLKDAMTFADRVEALQAIRQVLEDAGISAATLPPELRAAMIEGESLTMAMAELKKQAEDAATAAASIGDNIPGPDWLAGPISAAANLASQLWEAARAKAAAVGAGETPKRDDMTYGNLDWANSTKGFGRLTGEHLLGLPEPRGGSGRRGGGGGGGGGRDPVEDATEKYQRLIATLDPLARAEQQFAEAQATVNDALAKGVITSEEAARATALMGEEYAEAIAKANDAGDGFAKINDQLKDSILDLAADGVDSFDQLAAAIKRAAFEALLFGSGPMSGLFGGGSGLLGGLLGGAAGSVAPTPIAAAPKLAPTVAALASSRSGAAQISVNVSGARGNAEIESMVAQGVRSGIAQYDRQALPMRIKQISADGRRIG